MKKNWNDKEKNSKQSALRRSERLYKCRTPDTLRRKVFRRQDSHETQEVLHQAAVRWSVRGVDQIYSPERDGHGQTLAQVIQRSPTGLIF